MMKYSSAGCENPASAAKVDVKSGKVSAKKTWSPGAEKTGYTSKSMPAQKPAISTPEHSGGHKQNVKGSSHKRTAEAKQVAARKQ